MSLSIYVLCVVFALCLALGLSPSHVPLPPPPLSLGPISSSLLIYITEQHPRELTGRAMTAVSAIRRRLLRTLSCAPRLPSQPGSVGSVAESESSPALSPEIELDLLGPQGEDGAAAADHQPADCQQISSARRRVTQLTTAGPALESPASTPSSSPITTPTLPLPWPSRNASSTSLTSDTSSRKTPRSHRHAEAASVWRDYWS